MTKEEYRKQEAPMLAEYYGYAPQGESESDEAFYARVAQSLRNDGPLAVITFKADTVVFYSPRSTPEMSIQVSGSIPRQFIKAGETRLVEKRPDGNYTFWSDRDASEDVPYLVYSAQVGSERAPTQEELSEGLSLMSFAQLNGAFSFARLASG